MVKKEKKLHLTWLKALGWTLLAIIISMVFLALLHDDTGNNQRSLLFLFGVSFAAPGADECMLDT